MSRRAAIYVRISDDKTGAGLGVDRQEEDCRNLAERLGWQVVKVLQDNDISAYSGKPRPGYRDLLAAIRAGDVDAVICWHTDRLHRSPTELEEYIAVCEPRGVPTQTVKAGPLDLATPSGRMVARQLGAVSRFESEHHSERAKRARLQAATTGRWSGGLRPYGWQADGVTVNQAEAERIHWMAGQLLAGVSLRSIAARLNQQGARTSTGHRWTPKAVQLLLLRPRNAGLSVHRGEVVGRLPEGSAVLDEDTWRGVCAVLGDPARNTAKDRTRKWLLAGLAVCGKCGAPVESNVSAWRDRRAPAYTCPAGHVRRNAEDTDGYIETAVLAILAKHGADLLAPDLTGDTAALHAKDSALRARLDELGRLYGDGTIDARQLAEGTATIRIQREQVTAQLAAAGRGSVLAGVADAADPEQVWQGLDLSRRRAIVDVLMTVTILPVGRRGGTRRRGETYFDPDTVRIEPKRQPRGDRGTPVRYT